MCCLTLSRLVEVPAAGICSVSVGELFLNGFELHPWADRRISVGSVLQSFEISNPVRSPVHGLIPFDESSTWSTDVISKR